MIIIITQKWRKTVQFFCHKISLIYMLIEQAVVPTKNINGDMYLYKRISLFPDIHPSLPCAVNIITYNTEIGAIFKKVLLNANE